MLLKTKILSYFTTICRVICRVICHKYTMAFVITVSMVTMVKAKSPQSATAPVPLSKQLQKNSTPSGNEEQPKARFAHFGPSSSDMSSKDGWIPVPPPPPPIPGKSSTKQTQATFVDGCTGNCKSYKSQVINYQTCLKTEKQSQKDKCQSLIRKHITTNCNRQIPLDHYQTTEQIRLPGCNDNTLQNTQMAFVIEILSTF